MKLLKKNKIKNNLNTELKEIGVFSAVAGNQLPNQLRKRGLPALFHLRCPSQSHQRSAPWTHTSDDSYIYQLSFVLATATVSFILNQRDAHLNCKLGPFLTKKKITTRDLLVVNHVFFCHDWFMTKRSRDMNFWSFSVKKKKITIRDILSWLDICLIKALRNPHRTNAIRRLV